MEIDREGLRRGFEAGESLEVFDEGGSYEMWVEPYANPPAVFYEGKVFAYTELEAIITKLLAGLEHEQVHCRWVESRGLHAKACQEAHRRQLMSAPDLPL